MSSSRRLVVKALLVICLLLLTQPTNAATELPRDTASFTTELSLILYGFLTRENSSLMILDAEKFSGLITIMILVLLLTEL